MLNIFYKSLLQCNLLYHHLLGQQHQLVTYKKLKLMKKVGSAPLTMIVQRTIFHKTKNIMDNSEHSLTTTECLPLEASSDLL